MSQSRLARELGVADAVIIGLGAMIGAGVFAAIAPAAAVAGSGLLVALAAAGSVAYCNATSSAQLAARYPRSGGTYVYAAERLGPGWGFLAGWAFITGKVASCAAMALTVGAYAAPEFARPTAVAAVVGLTAVNYRGVRKTASLTRVTVALVLAVLAMVVAADSVGARWDPDDLTPIWTGPRAVLGAAGLWFFAFAGYARTATLGEEVHDPERTIPRAIPLALGITLVVYAAVAVSALAAAGPDALAGSDAPLVTATSAAGAAWVAPIVRAGGAIASLGVLLSLIAGVSRTAFAMAGNRELPSPLADVHPRFAVPHRAEVSVGVAVVALVLLTDLRDAIGFSSFNVLLYYGLANASAVTLPADVRRWPRSLAVAGVVGCAVLAFSLPLAAVVAGSAVVAVGVVTWFAVVRRRSDRS